MPKRGRCLSMGCRQLCLGQRQWTRRFAAAATNTAGRRESRKRNEIPQDTWVGGAQKGSLWLCYVRPLAGKQKSGMSGSWRRLKPTP